MKHSEYQVNKLLAYPDVLEDMRAGGDGRLTSVHLMPQNTCNQRCSFCSYRLPGNKNSSDFNEKSHIRLDRMYQLLDDFEDLGVKGVEVTGGGEPLAYPKTEELWDELRVKGFATALVTNGTLLKDRAPLIASGNLKWARVSIDCASRTTYAKMRMVPESQFDRAWRAVRDLRDCAPDDPEFRLGVGFVLSNENWAEVYDFILMARDNGADNVRLTVTYSDQHEGYYDEPAHVRSALASAEKAVDDFGQDIKVHNLMPDRWREVRNPTQDYHRCPTQQLLCVVEGEGRVYTCCTYTGSLLGEQGVFWKHPGGFKGLWHEKTSWRAKLDPREYCKVSCLYERRNKKMIELLEGPEQKPVSGVVHKEFI